MTEDNAAIEPSQPATDLESPSETVLETLPETSPTENLQGAIAQLEATKAQLEQEISHLNHHIKNLCLDSLKDLEDRRQNLQLSIEQLERRQERIKAELRQNFVGASQELAIRVQGFKEFLVNSMQDLVVTVEELDLLPAAPPTPEPAPAAATTTTTPKLNLSEDSFQEEAKRIKRLLEQYRATPNYYGPPWQLRRTFEPIHSERVETWFFDLGGRGALRSLNSRLQNILVSSAIISILRDFYGDMLRVLILADSPERLGDWRRGLQDCLGIARADFGPDRGIALFESADALTFRADRLEQEDYLPLILIDDSQESVSLSMLQYPLLLGFAPDPQLRQAKSNDFFE
ncbi:DUF3086 domain-containing protein [Candidatus Synechococcus calcipolaris G9]|uniref:DUF3086 domain-containing protein n=1 Tax=Candidatus Synechococcus calcipolaris G9 TaxID=1497997 RepID=A0ABT6EXT2_9SYNE|nr:DUF3086 domain-containing protein [Candidatus Synechococcus calcipolaris]MDG2990610.1 DUF3086 domain-containing protein [Candidatus Synechococcus calcipolaris G9]